MSARDAALRAVAVAALLGACREEGPTTGDAAIPSLRAEIAGQGVVTTDIVAGPREPPPAGVNPLAPTAATIGEGKRLYQWYNCAGCHGLNGGGGMGPPFADADWIYGSAPENLFQSIVQGRPGGMPAFGALADDHVWKLVAYVRTLGPVEPAGGGEEAPGELPTTGGSANRNGVQ